MFIKYTISWADLPVIRTDSRDPIEITLQIEITIGNQIENNRTTENATIKPNSKR